MSKDPPECLQRSREEDKAHFRSYGIQPPSREFDQRVVEGRFGDKKYMEKGQDKTKKDRPCGD